MPNKFNINKYVGTPQDAKTLKGDPISRQESLFVPEYGNFVTCAPYDDHFIYENPDKSEGTPAYMCTCGSVAVIAPPSPKGLFVCLFHATYQQHQTSVINKKDWEKSIGQTLRVKPAKRWQ